MQTTEKKLQSQVKTKLFFAATGFLALVALLTPKYGLVFGVVDIFQKSEALAETEQKIVRVEDELEEARDFYREEKDNYIVTAVRSGDTVNKILPSQVNRSEITRAIENFANKLSEESGKDVIFKSIDFNRVEEVKDKSYSEIPFRVSFATKKSNLAQILNFFEQTGRTTVNPAESERLMSVENINIRFLDDNQGRGNLDKDINLDLVVNAYSLKSEK